MRIANVMIAAAVVVAPSAAFADTVAYNSTPTAGFFFGSGTGYSPANTAVMTTDAGDELYLRWHERYPTSQFAPASDNSGTYSFLASALAPSFDFGVTTVGALSGYSGLITVTKLGSGQSASFDPFLLPDNAIQGNSLQNSENLSFGFLSGVGFTSGVDATYRVTLALTNGQGDTKSLSVDAKYGLGSAVPEPAAWAMMVGGFGFVGAAMRRRQRTKVSFA